MENIPFLDPKAGFKDGKIVTDLHDKLTVTNLCNQDYTNHSVVLRQTFCRSRLCSTEIGFEQTSWFVKTKHSKKLIISKTRTVKFDTGETNKRKK